MNNLMRLQRSLIPAIAIWMRHGRRKAGGKSAGPQGRRVASVLAALLPIALLSMPFAAPRAFALELITAKEAQLPDAVPRGITRSPTIRLISPDPSAKQVASPFVLKVSFEPHGGARIEPKTVKVTYLKSPSVDLTKRLEPYVSATGIEVNDTNAPPGTHSVRIEVRDSDGRTSDTIISLVVAK